MASHAATAAQAKAMRGFGPSTAHYEVLRVLGEGGFGKVWECADVRTEERVRWAVKQSKEVRVRKSVARVLECVSMQRTFSFLRPLGNHARKHAYSFGVAWPAVARLLRISERQRN